MLYLENARCQIPGAYRDDVSMINGDVTRVRITGLCVSLIKLLAILQLSLSLTSRGTDLTFQGRIRGTPRFVHRRQSLSGQATQNHETDTTRGSEFTRKRPRK